MKNGSINKPEEDAKDAFKEEVKKPYYNVHYLDSFKLPYDKLDVSIVIVTYNRCPYKPGTLKEDSNPLVWSIKTALMQKPRVKEIIIADDQSADYTEAISKKYQQISESENLSPIRYFKIPQRGGISKIRNFGAKQANGKYIFFTDDDGFLAPYSVFGSLYSFEELEKNGIKVGAVNVPLYVRTSVPKGFLPQKEIGYIDFIRGVQKSHKDFLPEEYFSKDYSRKFMDSELHILTPFQINHLNTVSLISKKAFGDVGGFPEHILKRMEDREFGCKLMENGYQIYFQPDPKFQFIHGSYGLHTGRKFEGEDWFKKMDKSISIKKAMEICDDPREDTGARIDPISFITDYILSFFILIYSRNKNGALKWVKKVHEEFVLNGRTGIFGTENMAVPPESERKEMWISAINQGLKLIKDKEKENVSKINLTLKKIKDSGKELQSNYMFDLLEGL